MFQERESEMHRPSDPGGGWPAHRLGRDRGWGIYTEGGRGSSQDASRKAGTRRPWREAGPNAKGDFKRSKRLPRFLKPWVLDAWGTGRPTRIPLTGTGTAGLEKP